MRVEASEMLKDGVSITGIALLAIQGEESENTV